jgi:hypothetical protein
MNRNATNAMSLDCDTVQIGQCINLQNERHDSNDEEYVLLVESANAADISVVMVLKTLSD